MPLRVDVNEMLTHPGEHTVLEIDEACTPELEVNCVGRLKGSLGFSSTTNLLVVLGSVAATLITECPRCLAEVRTDVIAEVDEEFTVEHGAITGLADDEAGLEDPAIAALYDGETLNVTELLRQSLILSAPGDPLCREDCAGLCPICGINRNEASCACEPPIESPLAVLAELYEKGGGEGSEET